MEWTQLFSDRRLKDVSIRKDSKRNPYQIDYDRIIFSDAFRKLQDKTQVFPLPGPIFVHNRLTHSLEVACVGRSLASMIGEQLIERYKWTASDDAYQFYNEYIGTVISAACLAHDIGNPPFGHSGEDAIRAFFNNEEGFIQKKIKPHFTVEEWTDFTLFEGNSMAFHILTHLDQGDSTPFNLTITTLSSVIKYPCKAINGFKKESADIAMKKSGYFIEDSDKAQAVFGLLGVPTIEASSTSYSRHPFVYITEAADDICYRIIDLEDAYRIGIVSYEKILELILPFFKIWYEEERYISLEAKLITFNSESHGLSFLRAIWINEMVQRCAEVFIANESVILNGEMKVSLLDALGQEVQGLIKQVDHFSYKYVYNYSASVAIEIGGFEIINELLSQMITATCDPHLPKSKKIIGILRLNKEYIESLSIKERVKFVLRELIGFTDSFALDFYKKLKGDFNNNLV